MLEVVGCERRAKICLARFHFTACRGSGIQYFFIFSPPGDKKFRKLSDREFAAKVVFKDRRKSNIDARGT